MYHLRDVFLAAWSRIQPMLDANPLERAARLARRRNTARLQRPLREWCVAVKANDRRWNPHDFTLTPEKAATLHIPHDVTVDQPALRRLCHPVTTASPDSLLKDAARSFGVTPAYLLAAARRGQLRLRRLK